MRNTVGISTCTCLWAYLTTHDGDGRMTAICKACIRPKRTVCRWQFAIASSRIVVRTAGIVTLTHGAHVTATIDEPANLTAIHGHGGITIDPAGRPAVNSVIGRF